MKKLFSVVLLFISSICFGQNPVSWQVSSIDLGDSAYEIKIEADLEKGWHLYSQFLESDEGPLSTYITYENSNFELIGKTEEVGVETHMDPVWEMDISFFSNHATFIQKVKSLNPDSLLLKGNVNFMVCDDSQCLPPENYTFQVNLAAGNEIIEEVVYKTDSSTYHPYLDWYRNIVFQSGIKQQILANTSFAEGLSMEVVFLMIVGIILCLGFIVLIIVSQWKVFTKARQPGWACLVPFYNIYIMTVIAQKPAWWTIILLIPIVNIIFLVMLLNGISTAFGKGVGFTFGLLFLSIIFWPILAFDNSSYKYLINI